ncbi:MAG: ATP-binding protein [Candidatus Omnitrophica bacterium]|nr:ATP-binding protein [Candidatus Omnitrophota bacterium]
MVKKGTKHIYNLFIFSILLAIFILEAVFLWISVFLRKDIVPLVLNSIIIILGIAATYLIVFSLKRSVELPLDSLVNKVRGYIKINTPLLENNPIGYLDRVTMEMKKELDAERVRVSAMQKLHELIFKAYRQNDLIDAVAKGLSFIPHIEGGLVLLTNREKTKATLYPLIPKDIIPRKEFILGEGGISLSQIKIVSPVYREQLINSNNLNELEKVFTEKNYFSSLTVAIKNEEDFFGLLGLAIKEKGNFLKEDTVFLENVADLMGLKLANMQLAGELRQKREEIIELKHSHKEYIDRKMAEQIAELKNIYSQLIQTGKMASLGRLSAGIAHELNNPIGGILGYTQLVLTKLKKPNLTCQDIENIIGILEMMEKESKRCQWIVSNLLNFARKPLDERRPLDVKEVIDNTISMMEYQLVKNNIKVSLSFPPDGLKKINGNANELQQVFTNLIQNAQDAMPEGGELTITGNNKLDSRYSPPREYIELVFSDTGVGIPKENLDKIFDPFFSSKIGKIGTGLGLSISYAIISSHHGYIKVESQEGKGTTFSIILPVIKETTN